MEWIERFNNVINYIEENITQQIDYGEIAKIACCSSYHFQRMFTGNFRPWHRPGKFCRISGRIYGFPAGAI